MLNMGGPRNLDEVYLFLNRLFSDPDLIPLPMQQHLAPWIARRRTPKIQAQYAKIGGGSPIGEWTRRQGELMCRHLDRMSPETAPHKSYTGFRYAEPLTGQALEEMQKDEIESAVVFTQYPQYSCSTTGSSLNDLARQLKSSPLPQIKNWSVIDRWATHPGLVQSFAELIESHLQSEYSSDKVDDVVLLFSAHSLPMSVVNRGDTYPSEVAATVEAVMHRLGKRNPYRLVWQSQVGPSPWLGPRTDKALEGLAKAGKQNVCLIPIAFTSDHIETLFELDIEYCQELARDELKMTGVSRCPSLNVHPTFITALADIVHDHLKSDRQVQSRQWALQCPGCSKDSCKQARQVLTCPVASGKGEDIDLNQSKKVEITA